MPPPKGAPAHPAHRAPKGEPPCGRTRVILFTDSHGLTDFGGFMEERLRALPDIEVASFTLGGSAPHWLPAGHASPRAYFYSSCSGEPPNPRAKLVHKQLRGPALGALLDAGAGVYERQVVLLAYGSNVPGMMTSYRGSVEQVVRLVRERPNAACVWIGPPEMRKRSPKWLETVYRTIREGILAAGDGKEGACLLVDSRPYAKYPARVGDGVHYPFSPPGVAAVQAWVDGVMKEIEPVLRPPANAAARLR